MRQHKAELQDFRCRACGTFLVCRQNRIVSVAKLTSHGEYRPRRGRREWPRAALGLPGMIEARAPRRGAFKQIGVSRQKLATAGRVGYLA